jgi:CubicO group peptidase (beta-lactamase class C family)
MPITRRFSSFLPALALPLVLLPTARPVHGQTAQPSPRNTAPLPVDAPAFSTSVDSLFTPWRGSDRPGCAVGVSHDGRVILERAYGMADIESGAPMTPATVVHSASVSKQVTALAVLLLVRDGKLSLDDDVRRWLPEERPRVIPSAVEGSALQRLRPSPLRALRVSRGGAEERGGAGTTLRVEWLAPAERPLHPRHQSL